MHLNVGLILDSRYRILDLLKIGGMSNIYKVEDTRLERICVLKELTCQIDDDEEVRYAVKRFKEEAKLLSDLNHINLPRVSDYFTQGVFYYLVMDFIDGVDLEVLLRKNEGKGLDEDSVLNWAIQVCDVLDYLHKQTPKPVIYRDLKPANIMLRYSSERIVLVDFGIARKLDIRGAVTAIGTMEYAPIEQYQGRAEPRSDIYGLGATMHHLLTARAPVPFKFPKIRTFRPELSYETEEIVEKALYPRAEDRYQSAKEMQGALLGLYSSRKINPQYRNNPEFTLKESERALIERLQKGDKVVARLLGDKKVKNAVEPLIKALESDDGGMRKEAALSLGKIGDPAAIPYLVELLKRERTSGNLKIEEALKLLKASSGEDKDNSFWIKLKNLFF